MTSLGTHINEKHFARLRLVKTPSDGSGWFRGLASTWDIDRDGERFAFGAWRDSIFEWQKAASMPPLFFSHRTDEPDRIIGRLLSMQETVDGLLIEGQLDLTNKRAQEVYERMLAGTLDAMSVGFVGEGRRDDDGVGVITKAELLEVSLTPVPSNIHARVSAVKNVPPPPVHSTAGLPGDPVHYNRLLDDLMEESHPAASDVDVDALITAVRLEMVEEKLAEARASSFNAELTERAAHTGPVPEFDKRFAVTSVPTEYESGDTEPEQVVGYPSETFRIAVLPGTMRPDNE